MPGDGSIEVGDETGDVTDLFVGVVLARYQQRGDLDPDPFFMGILDRLKYRFELGTADLFVKCVGKAFDVYIHTVDVGCQQVDRFFCLISTGDIDVLETFFMGELRGVISVLEKDDRLVIGIGDGGAAILLCEFNDALRGQLLTDDLVVMFLRVLGDVGILTELAGEVSADRTD